MPTITDTAICLRRWEFSETSQTVCLFTREHGVLRGLAKGARRERGKFSGGFELLTRGEIVAIVKPGRDLATLTEWHLAALHRAARTSLAANRAALFMTDLVLHLVTDHDPHPRLYDAMVRALEDLTEPATSLLRFQWAALAECGYQPELDRDAETGHALPDADVLAFSAEHGGLIADLDAPRSWRMRRSTVDVLRSLARDEPIADAVSIDRANRLLAVYARELVGRDLPTITWSFPDLTNA